ncbi:MAG: hypothetical protein ABW221_01615 [Vicinamibacteria bacterium]
MPSLRRRKPAPKKKAAKKQAAKKVAKKKVARRPTRQSRGAVSSAKTKEVKFACDNASVVRVTIRIKQTGEERQLEPDATFDVPTGTQRLRWSARGPAGAEFNVTVTGGSMDDTITGPLPSGGDGGQRDLVVS